MITIVCFLQPVQTGTVARVWAQSLPWLQGLRPQGRTVASLPWGSSWLPLAHGSSCWLFLPYLIIRSLWPFLPSPQYSATHYFLSFLRCFSWERNPFHFRHWAGARCAVAPVSVRCLRAGCASTVCTERATTLFSCQIFFWSRKRGEIVLFSQSFSRACSLLPFNTKQFLLADAAGTDFPISSIQAYTTRFCPISAQHN